jgi:D-alanyl-D-alanine dipeptidase
MGSDYDFFGREAHIDHYNFSEKILMNRKLLIDGMRMFGFNTVRTEWWHFSYKKNWSYPTLNVLLPCEDE